MKEKVYGNYIYRLISRCVIYSTICGYNSVWTHRDDGTSTARISLVDCFISALVVIDNIIIQSNTVVDDSIQRIVLFEEIKIRSQNFKILVYDRRRMPCNQSMIY
jgi:hypothetical protein